MIFFPSQGFHRSFHKEPGETDGVETSDTSRAACVGAVGEVGHRLPIGVLGAVAEDGLGPLAGALWTGVGEPLWAGLSTCCQGTDGQGFRVGKGLRVRGGRPLGRSEHPLPGSWWAGVACGCPRFVLITSGSGGLSSAMVSTSGGGGMRAIQELFKKRNV